MESVQTKIANHKGVFITLDEIRSLAVASSYDELCETVNDLLRSGLLKPAGKGRSTNGMVPPLRLKYRIVRPKRDNSAELLEIRSLLPVFSISGYLQHPALYRKHRDILLPLDRFLKTRKQELRQIMSENERAFSIWHDEKMLDSARCWSVLRFNHLDLNTYATPEPFFDYLCSGRRKVLLVLENKDVWYTLRRLMLEKPRNRCLFGTEIDGVVLGEGAKAARPHALEEYAALLQEDRLSFLYFGDLDYSGIGIYLSIRAASPDVKISLFLPAYRAMLAQGKKSNYGVNHSNQQEPERMVDFLSLFSPEEADEITQLLAAGHYIPQEILNYPLLKENMTSPEEGHA
jgi:hypothetical protein